MRQVQLPKLPHQLLFLTTSRVRKPPGVIVRSGFQQPRGVAIRFGWKNRHVLLTSLTSRGSVSGDRIGRLGFTADRFRWIRLSTRKVVDSLLIKSSLNRL